MPSSLGHVSHPSFNLFSQLAPEIRLKIWQYACPERTVSIRYLPEKDVCLATAKPPAVLQVCHESRTESLRIYTLSFGTHSNPARIYFNPSRDTLYLPRHRKMGYDDALRDFRLLLHDDKVLEEVKAVAIDNVDGAIKRPWETYNKLVLLRSLPNLKQVVLVLGDGTGDRLVEPKQNPEDLLRIWAAFRQSVVMEEKELENIFRGNELDYVKWQLPPIRIRCKDC